MLHACFVYIPTCFMCTFIHFLAFSGTNLLTRCRSVSSCFLLFLCSRKVAQEIFSELDQTKAEVPIFPVSKTQTWRESKRGHMVAKQLLGAIPPLAVPRVC